MAASGFFLGGLAMVESGICHQGQEKKIYFFICTTSILYTLNNNLK